MEKGIPGKRCHRDKGLLIYIELVVNPNNPDLFYRKTIKSWLPVSLQLILGPKGQQFTFNLPRFDGDKLIIPPRFSHPPLQLSAFRKSEAPQSLHKDTTQTLKTRCDTCPDITLPTTPEP